MALRTSTIVALFLCLTTPIHFRAQSTSEEDDKANGARGEPLLDHLFEILRWLYLDPSFTHRSFFLESLLYPFRLLVTSNRTYPNTIKKLK